MTIISQEKTNKFIEVLGMNLKDFKAQLYTEISYNNENYYMYRQVEDLITLEQHRYLSSEVEMLTVSELDVIYSDLNEKPYKKFFVPKK